MKRYIRQRSYFALYGEDLENLKKVVRWVRNVRQSEDYQDYPEEEQDIFIAIEEDIEQLFDHVEWDEE